MLVTTPRDLGNETLSRKLEDNEKINSTLEEQVKRLKTENLDLPPWRVPSRYKRPDYATSYSQYQMLGTNPRDLGSAKLEHSKWAVHALLPHPRSSQRFQSSDYAARTWGTTPRDLGSTKLEYSKSVVHAPHPQRERLSTVGYRRARSPAPRYRPFGYVSSPAFYRERHSGISDFSGPKRRAQDEGDAAPQSKKRRMQFASDDALRGRDTEVHQ